MHRFSNRLQTLKPEKKEPLNCANILVSFFLILFSDAAYPAAPFSHHLLDQVLGTYVDSLGRVDYAGLKKSRELLDAYTDSLAVFSPQSHPERFPTPDHSLAYWINAYNALVLKGVVDAYPVASVKDIKVLNGFFSRTTFFVGSRTITLDEIENKIIRPQFKDARIHAVVNCAAASCPGLEGRAFSGEDLQERLQAAFYRFANDPQFVFLDREKGKLYLSKILDWYGRDFRAWFPAERISGTDKPTLLAYLSLYLPAEDANFLRQHPELPIYFKPYNWALNQQSKP